MIPHNFKRSLELHLTVSLKLIVVKVGGFLYRFSDIQVTSRHKGLPGCFFTRNSLPKSSNNLEPICNNVNM